MKKIVLVIGFVLIATSALAMGELYASYSKRIKTTITIETPEGLITGTAVREVSNSRAGLELSWTQAIHNPIVRGEGVVINLGERGVLFATISDQTHKDLYHAFPLPEKAESSVEGIKHYEEKLRTGMRGPISLEDYAEYTKIVYFKDITDPKTVALVWGNYKNYETRTAGLIDNFEETLGAGVHIVSVEAEVVDEPITFNNVDRYLGTGFWEKQKAWIQSIGIRERRNLTPLFKLKRG
ncbi:MAG: hypothetical protein CL561_12840 [Alphaproteobacteria bacterium]|nr:hypothetical protein [Alphaproteobacteria bacterium]|tara:strand:+ start:401 stop:1117 length:717 start_codon:yes stop_codon:yes gene_type:complete